jgi:thymidylate kinase
MMEKVSTPLIVLTGGPGAGKTAVLEFVRKILPEKIVIFPETASILFGGGFWRLQYHSAKRAAQRAIYHVQQEMQNLIVDERKWSLGLCDRGTLDSLAYWPGDEADFFLELGTDFQKEYAKYTAVIHLKTPTLARGYNHQNPVRTESPEAAARIDQKIHQVWKNHPNYCMIDSTENFLEKIHLAISCLQTYVPDTDVGSLYIKE